MGLQGAQSSQWDQIFEEISAGRAFTRGASATGGAGQHGGVQVYNPQASGKTVQIVRAYVGSDTAQFAWFRRSATPLTTLIDKGHNLLTGLSDSGAEVRTDTNAPVIMGLVFPVNLLVRSYVLALDLWGPQLSAGEGYMFVADTVATVIRARFDWIEFDT